MKYKKIKLIVIFLVCIAMIFPENTIAKSSNRDNKIYSYKIEKMSKKKSNKKVTTNTTNTTNNNTSINNENTTMKCDDSDEAILGNVQDSNSVAWLLQKIFNYLKIIGPSLAIILGAIDFIKTIILFSENFRNLKCLVEDLSD